MGLLNNLWNGLLDLVYPELQGCLYCEESELVTDDIHLCQNCLEKIEYITDNYCQKCGKVLSEEKDYCDICEDHKYLFNKARSVALYSGGIPDYIHDFKYEGRQALAQPLGKLLGIYGLEFYDRQKLDLIIPVPLAEEKFKNRGFNQAYLLAKEVGGCLDLPVDNRVLKRAVNTASQSKLSLLERKENVNSVFYCEPEKTKDIKGKNILLIDDIYTTGSTVNECSKVLLRAGAKEVSVLTLATGQQLPNKF
ncbi:ComF family protein [Selenihalanaerobacter shriftii]|uniref:ComF family protein n=1 Tax=Selenihalanaerobacter shriftii TaxID=142842 RepID=A0A1T4KPP2_9FIRM|nr:ComF family protein [Selenihalanaerobacter shriftii]SJZ44372.1 comF family protein [Selenihalanaerobacter shriftii]